METEMKLEHIRVRYYPDELWLAEYNGNVIQLTGSETIQLRNFLNQLNLGEEK